MPLTLTPWGRMNDVCREVLETSRWEVVRSLEITTPRPPHDVQTADPTVTIALYRRTGDRPASGTAFIPAR